MLTRCITAGNFVAKSRASLLAGPGDKSDNYIKPGLRGSIGPVFETQGNPLELGLGHAPVQPVARIPGVIRKIELCGQALAIINQYLDMYVWCATRVGDRLYRAKQVTPVGPTDIVTESLEPGIPGCSSLVRTMQVATINIALPDFDTRARDRFPTRIENSSAKCDDFTTGLFNLASDLDQVAVDILEAHLCRRIKRTFASGWRRRKSG
jgi:hypothetical protein